MAVVGDWTVEILATARIKGVKKRIEPLLRELEAQEISAVMVDHLLEWQNPRLFRLCEALSVTYASRDRRHGRGLLTLGMPGRGGAVDQEGTAVPQWLADFLRDPARADVLAKLQGSGAAARHVFVIVGLCGTPWPVESYLMSDFTFLPPAPADLPQPVTAAWVGMLDKKILHWNGRGWELFEGTRR
jgi:hypothetical protein